VSTLDRFRLLTTQEKDSIRQEIINNCDLVADCWVYRTKNSAGYGVKRIGGKVVTVSRFMLAYATRESLDVKADACHVRECPYRACCNPVHLTWGSHSVNAKMREADKREYRSRGANLLPVPLGHETHVQHAAGIGENYSIVDSSLQHLIPTPEQVLYA
jgi:hypothetical protein